MEQYITLNEMKDRIENRFDVYLYEVLGIFRKDALKKNSVAQDIIDKGRKKALKEIVGWEKEINTYKNELSQVLSLELINDYEKRELKELLAHELWTISSALKTLNEDLKRYRDSFHQMPAQKIYTAVEAILNTAENYYQNVFPDINPRTIICPEDFELILPEETRLEGVIGFGIRSEILHRLYPSTFPIMTRKSVWGMFFLAFENTEESELIIDENGSGENVGKSRTSTNWEYDYLRFLFYSNFISNMLEQAFNENDIKFSDKYRFGYVNLFLSNISAKNKKFIAELTRWKYTGAK